MPDQTIKISRPSVASPVPPPQKLESKFPTETITLPSHGNFYPPESPLANGTIELRMLCARDEDILTSKNMIQKGIVLDKLLESVVVDKTINLSEIFVCDRNAIFVALRRLAYGDQYEATMTCGRCGKENTITIDISKMDNRPFDFESYPKGINSFIFKLPSSGVTLTYKLLTKKDEDIIEREMEAFTKITKDFTKEITTRLIHIITAVDGNTDAGAIRKFVSEELRAKDSLAFRKYLRESLPDIDTTFEFNCNYCNLERKEEMPIGVSFFWPNS